MISPIFALPCLSLSFLCEKYWPNGKGSQLAGQYCTYIWVACLLYTPVLLALQNLMKHREAFKLHLVTFTWNMVLAFLSFLGAIILVLGERQILLKLFHPEVHYRPSTRAVIAIFTLTKVVEFGDTIILVLKKKSLTFLHCYHHVTVVLYCWHAQVVNASYAHNFCFFNLSIHALMYFYYGMTTVLSSLQVSGSAFSVLRRPLKVTLAYVRPYITLSQIIQMFFGLFLSLNAVFSNQVLPHERSNVYFAVFLYMTYAWLFTQFYISSYVPKKQQSSSPPPLDTSFKAPESKLKELLHERCVNQTNQLTRNNQTTPSSKFAESSSDIHDRLRLKAVQRDT